MAKRKGYRFGVAWIADNDEPEDRSAESVSGYVSTLLLADLFGKDALDVGKDVVRLRDKRLADSEAEGAEWPTGDRMFVVGEGS